MRIALRSVPAFLLCASLAANAQPLPDAARTPALASVDGADDRGGVGEIKSAPGLPLRARLDKEAIRAAIADLPAETDADPRRHAGDTLSATPAEQFSRDFAQARLPDCLHSEGLKNQPTFFLSGFLALPFIAVAKVRGVCR